MSEIAELFYPAIRWDSTHGYEQQRDSIGEALQLGVGGFILFGGPSEHVITLTEDLHTKSRVPLLIGADLERGAGQQFGGETALPPLAAIASLEDVQAIRRAAAITAREARELGINWIYAPDCDLDIEPDNPIIGTRSFGGDPERVAEFAAAWIDACQAEGVLASAKHFPGHGRTTTDSHKELPHVDVPAETLRAMDLVPFRRAIERGVASVMSAHVSFPALDPSGAPATLSKPILTGLLREELEFTGLVVTDALIMEGVLGGGEAEAVVRALDAGCDCLLYPSNIVEAERAIQKAIDDKRLDADRVHQSIERRRRWARWAALSKESNRPTRDETGWASQLAEQVVHMVQGRMPALPRSWNLVIVDDDVGGPYPPPPRDPLITTLQAGGIDLVVGDQPATEEVGATVIALFGDIRAWKGRPGYSQKAKDGVKRALESAGSRDRLIIQFSHPRLANELKTDAPILCAWGGEGVMQKAAARVLLRETATNSAERPVHLPQTRFEESR
ncbi:MAG TPA: glycoside hydrolase family 3 N-terminal domain-containing protein [Gemmatimonadaceae bacterium]|nr:glycoside hydrolase family 3 N-terminal domain-containing protein [Gemmatimonadaceae bacterium]